MPSAVSNLTSHVYIHAVIFRVRFLRILASIDRIRHNLNEEEF
jgi:hypothetical protein